MITFNLIAQIVNPALPTGFGQNAADREIAFANYIVLLWRALIVLGGLAALVFMLLGAFDWVTAGGDEGKIKSARQKITQSIIGLALLASTIALVTLVERLLGVSLLDIQFPTPGGVNTPVNLPAVPQPTSMIDNAIK